MKVLIVSLRIFCANCSFFFVYFLYFLVADEACELYAVLCISVSYCAMSASGPK